MFCFESTHVSVVFVVAIWKGRGERRNSISFLEAFCTQEPFNNGKEKSSFLLVVYFILSCFLALFTSRHFLSALVALKWTEKDAKTRNKTHMAIHVQSNNKIGCSQLTMRSGVRIKFISNYKDNCYARGCMYYLERLDDLQATWNMLQSNSWANGHAELGIILVWWLETSVRTHWMHINRKHSILLWTTQATECVQPDNNSNDV